MKYVLPNAALFGVFWGEMVGQFSDGHWENSRYNDWKMMTENTVMIGEDDHQFGTNKLPYRMKNFFMFVKKERLDCIVSRVLAIYDNGDVIQKAYDNSKDDAFMVVEALRHVDCPYFLGEQKNTSEHWLKHCENMKNIVIKYFGSIDDFLKLQRDITEDDYKRFRKIGTELDRVFGR